MNNGKICVSVCAETADEMIEQIKRAEDLADVIEIRFDCLENKEIQKKRHDLCSCLFVHFTIKKIYSTAKRSSASS